MSEQARAWYGGWMITRKGGPGSGNWGHAGRKGSRGGSLPRSTAMSLSTGATAQERQEAARGQGKVAQTLEEAQGQEISRQTVLDHIMSTNPPEQVKSGKMTPQGWAERYMSDGDQEFALINVHPGAMYLPTQTVAGKVSTYTQKEGPPPPIVVDSNNKIEARFGGGKLSRAYGRQPHTVIDGKHRVQAALKRGDKALRAYVPKHQLRTIWERSHEIERNEFAQSYFERKGYPLLETGPQGWQIERQGREQTYTPRDMERIARNTGHAWTWA